jgi:hypothetical protein
MLSSPTTFILGAGASVDLGFPTGDELQKKIATLLALAETRHDFADASIQTMIDEYTSLGEKRGEKHQYTSAASRISAAMPVAGSIDNFLHTHSNDPHVIELGKLAIAHVILQAEKRLATKEDGGGTTTGAFLSSYDYEKSWYSPFIKMLTSGTQSSRPEALFENARFIVFNYDRNLELVLKLTFQHYFGLSDAEAFEILSRVEIIHPYGSLGSLNPALEDAVSFGADSSRLFQISKKIQTFTESVDSETVQRAQQFIADADTLVFLGFGFLNQNMDVLAPRVQCEATRIHATTKGISDTDKVVVGERLKRFATATARGPYGKIADPAVTNGQHGFIDVNNDTCFGLLTSHRYRLAT